MYDVDNQATKYIQMFERIMNHGSVVSPRGLEIREIEDLQLEIDPRYPFMTFDDRNYSVNYFKTEMIWKLTADRFNDSIKKHAKMWTQVQNPDGSFNSNYGQYWFGEQSGFWYVVSELVRDQDSRRAVIPMLNASHFGPHVKDTVCTECVGFRIRKGEAGSLQLNMSVHMRSSDVIFGLGTDIPTFAFLYRLVLATLRHQLSEIIDVGKITITAMSSHIYARHYDMVNAIISNGIFRYNALFMPWADGREALKIASSRGNEEILKDSGELGAWLCRQL